MDNFIIVSAVIITIFILFYKYKNVERFISAPQDVMHAKFDYLGKLQYVSDKPPCYRGEYGCKKIKCPSEHHINMFQYPTVCWYCKDIIEDPIDNP